MSAHNHSRLTPGCYRCELARDEARAAAQEMRAEAVLYRGIAKRFIEEPLFSDDYDNALVAARLDTWADELESDARELVS